MKQLHGLRFSLVQLFSVVGWLAVVTAATAAGGPPIGLPVGILAIFVLVGLNKITKPYSGRERLYFIIVIVAAIAGIGVFMVPAGRKLARNRSAVRLELLIKELIRDDPQYRSLKVWSAPRKSFVSVSGSVANQNALDGLYELANKVTPQPRINWSVRVEDREPEMHQ